MRSGSAREGSLLAAIAADVPEECACAASSTRDAVRLSDPEESCARRSLFATPRSAEGRAVLAPRPRQPSQSLHLPRPRRAAGARARSLHFALRPARPALPRRVRDRQSDQRSQLFLRHRPEAPHLTEPRLVRDRRLPPGRRRQRRALRRRWPRRRERRCFQLVLVVVRVAIPASAAAEGAFGHRLMARASPGLIEPLRAGLGDRHRRSSRWSTSGAGSVPAATCAMGAGEPRGNSLLLAVGAGADRRLCAPAPVCAAGGARKWSKTAPIGPTSRLTASLGRVRPCQPRRRQLAVRLPALSDRSWRLPRNAVAAGCRR